MSWVFYTIFAVILQTIRNLEQKKLNKKFDDLTVIWSRFILPLPLAVFVVVHNFSLLNGQFYFHCLITATLQVAGNIFLLKTFKAKNFSIGIASYKTEVLQTVIIGYLFFGQILSLSAVSAIIITAIGTIMLSGLNFKDGIKNFSLSCKNSSVIFGLLAGFCYSITAFNLKEASDYLINLHLSGIKSSFVVLMTVICGQNALFIIIKTYQKIFQKNLTDSFYLENKWSFLRASIISFSASSCWFIAFSTGNVIYVKAVAQIELVIALGVSYFLLKEKLKPFEIAGILLIGAGILFLIIDKLQYS